MKMTKGKMTQDQKYIVTFFEEKGIDFDTLTFTVDLGDTIHYLDGEILYNVILNVTRHEVKKIANTLRYIDFRNGDVMHYLNYLAEVYVKTEITKWERGE